MGSTSANDVDDRGFGLGYSRVFGEPGPDVTMWGIGKKDTLGKYRRQESPGEDGSYAKQWPLSDLSVETIRDRWGAGEYRVYWFILDPENPEVGERNRPGGSGTPFRLREQETVQVSGPPAPSPAVAPSDFDKAMGFMALADERAARQLGSILTTASALAGRGSGLDAATLSLILDRQSAQTADLVRTLTTQHSDSLAALRAEMAAMRADLTDAEDEGEGAVSSVVRAASPLFRAGQPAGENVKAAVLNYAAEHPDKLIEALKTVPQIITALAKFGQQQQQQQQAPLQQRPRAIHAANLPLPLAPAPASEPRQPGINEFLTQAPPPPEPVSDASSVAAE